MNIDRRILFVIAAVLGLVILIEAGMFLQNKLKKRSSIPPVVEEVPGQTNVGHAPPAPTASPEEIKAIAKAQTHQIKVSVDKTEPANLTAKLYDQVRWDNQTNQKMIIKVLGQTSPPLTKGKRFLVSFKQKGSFDYQVLLDSQEKFRGKIKVE